MSKQEQIILNTDDNNRLKLNEQLSVLMLTPQKSRQLTRQIARDVRSLARRNIRAQKTVTGAPMAKRADRSNRRKMLRGLSKKMVAFSRGNDSAVVTWKQGHTAKIAYAQQHGSTTRMTARKAAQGLPKTSIRDKATRAQAKALLSAGYRQPIRKKNGYGVRRVSQKWITENLSKNQAGFVLRLLQNQTPKAAWSIKLPSRPFLGASDKDAERFKNQIVKDALNKIRQV